MNGDSQKITSAQAEALVRLLARATNAGILPSMLDTFALLDLIEEGLRNPREARQS